MLKFEDLKINKKKCIILACGPSLKEVNPNKIKKMSKEWLIITIKQSYFQFQDVSDFHFFNCNNFTKYKRNKAKFICCSSVPLEYGKKKIWGDQEIDLFYQITNSKKFSQFHNLNDCFDKVKFGSFRGPGIMFEIVMPFVFNLGIKEIVTAGWDYHSEEGVAEHFYNEINRKKMKNPANLPYNGENKESIENSKKLKSYFDKHKISLKCLKSNKCFLNKSIERIRI